MKRLPGWASLTDRVKTNIYLHVQRAPRRHTFSRRYISRSFAISSLHFRPPSPRTSLTAKKAARDTQPARCRASTPRPPHLVTPAGDRFTDPKRATNLCLSSSKFYIPRLEQPRKQPTNTKNKIVCNIDTTAIVPRPLESTTNQFCAATRGALSMTARSVRVCATTQQQPLRNSPQQQRQNHGFATNDLSREKKRRFISAVVTSRRLLPRLSVLSFPGESQQVHTKQKAGKRRKVERRTYVRTARKQTRS